MGSPHLEATKGDSSVSETKDTYISALSPCVNALMHEILATEPPPYPNEASLGEDEISKSSAGQIVKLTASGFMDRGFFEVSFAEGGNIILEESIGNLPSVILTALSVGLGAKAPYIYGQNSRKALISANYARAIISIQFRNEGDTAHDPDIFGSAIWLETRISRAGRTHYSISGIGGHKIGISRVELDQILRKLNHNPINPLSILPQRSEGVFKSGEEDTIWYTFLIENIGLQAFVDSFKELSWTHYSDSREAKRKLENEADDISDSEGECDARDQIIDLHSKRIQMCAQFLGAVRCHEKTLGSATNKISQLDPEITSNRLKVSEETQKIESCRASFNVLKEEITDLESELTKFESMIAHTNMKVHASSSKIDALLVPLWQEIETCNTRLVTESVALTTTQNLLNNAGQRPLQAYVEWHKMFKIRLFRCKRSYSLQERKWRQLAGVFSELAEKIKGYDEALDCYLSFSQHKGFGATMGITFGDTSQSSTHETRNRVSTEWPKRNYSLKALDGELPNVELQGTSFSDYDMLQKLNDEAYRVFVSREKARGEQDKVGKQLKVLKDLEIVTRRRIESSVISIVRIEKIFRAPKESAKLIHTIQTLRDTLAEKQREKGVLLQKRSAVNVNFEHQKNLFEKFKSARNGIFEKLKKIQRAVQKLEQGVCHRDVLIQNVLNERTNLAKTAEVIQRDLDQHSGVIKRLKFKARYFPQDKLVNLGESDSLEVLGARVKEITRQLVAAKSDRNSSKTVNREPLTASSLKAKYREEVTRCHDRRVKAESVLKKEFERLQSTIGLTKQVFAECLRFYGIEGGLKFCNSDRKVFIKLQSTRASVLNDEKRFFAELSFLLSLWKTRPPRLFGISDIDRITSPRVQRDSIGLITDTLCNSPTQHIIVLRNDTSALLSLNTSNGSKTQHVRIPSEGDYGKPAE